MKLNGESGLEIVNEDMLSFVIIITNMASVIFGVYLIVDENKKSTLRELKFRQHEVDEKVKVVVQNLWQKAYNFACFEASSKNPGLFPRTHAGIIMEATRRHKLGTLPFDDASLYSIRPAQTAPKEAPVQRKLAPLEDLPPVVIRKGPPMPDLDADSKDVKEEKPASPKRAIRLESGKLSGPPIPGLAPSESKQEEADEKQSPRDNKQEDVDLDEKYSSKE